jgi:signal transduction histidine kinase/HAMP domain-containing protein
MEFILTLLAGSTPFLQWPPGGWLIWVAYLGVLLALLWRLRDYQPDWGAQAFSLLIPLFIGQVIATLVFGIRVPLAEPLPIPGLLSMLDSVTWMALAAVPWLLAGGLIGPLASFILALLSGLLLAVFQTHNPFTALEHGLSGILLGAALHQRYRTIAFRLLRRPLAAALLLAALHPLFYVLGVTLWLDAPFAIVLDFAFASMPHTGLAFAAAAVLAGVAGEAARFALPAYWGSADPLTPSPAERSLETRSFHLMGWVVGVVALSLALLGWNSAYRAAESLIRERMETSAALAAGNVPFALEIGQNLILDAAGDPRLNDFDQAAIDLLLDEKINRSAYFDQLLVVESVQGIVASAGTEGLPVAALMPQETAGIKLALEGVPFQYYSVASPGQGASALISFIAPIPERQRVLVGRTDLARNPFTAPLLTNLNQLQDIGGEGFLMDESGLILYHPEAALVNTIFESQLPAGNGFGEITGLDGMRRIVFTQASIGRPWRVAVSVSVQEIQRLALSIAAPLLGLLLALSLALMLLLRVTLRVVTGSLRGLADQASRIAEDNAELATPLVIEGVDEVGRMRLAFDRMRASLKARLDEQEQLLLASHGAASSLDFELAVRPVLDAALTFGAVSARVVLAPGAAPETGGETGTAFGAGPAGDLFAYLDGQILGLNRNVTPVVMANPAGDRRLSFGGQAAVPVALVGAALRHKGEYFGSLWLAYNRPHVFLAEETRFLTTLAGQASLAAANARLFLSAEIGRQRLAAILASTPDPVLVTDEDNRLLLSNPAAWQILGKNLASGSGKPIHDLLAQPKLVDILQASRDDAMSLEITVGDDQVFVAKATDVLADGRQVGRVCVLRDVTRFKELDTLKSEFVSTVSHDLRSPLTLMRGYATMLEMVGNLNEEQQKYLQRMSVGVDSMTRLVNNLLDLGRIEAGVDLNLEMVPLRRLLHKVVESLQVAAAHKQVELAVLFAGETEPVVEADAGLIEQAVHNLVENAVKYTLEGGRVVAALRVVDGGQNAVIEVRDTGIGIAPPDQLRLFERFYRVAHRETRKQRGSGLGLAIVKSIVERHNGRVWVESELDRGSTFTVVLPLKQFQAE